MWDKHPRRMRARGGRYEVMEGEVQYERFIVAEYETFDIAKTYFNSPEYQAAAEFRRRAGNINELVIVEGVTDGAGRAGA